MYSERELGGDELKAWERHVRDRVPEEIAEKAIQEVTANPRLVNGTVDENLVYRMAGLLRRIADRKDARCVTYAELREIAERFPRENRREPVDPVPAIDRPHGAATVTGTRIYSESLLAHLRSSGGQRPERPGDEAVTTLVNADVAWKGKDVAVIGTAPDEVTGWLERRAVARVERFEQPSANESGNFDIVTWPSGFERGRPAELGDRLDVAAAMLRDGGALVLRVRTLGLSSEAVHNGDPPLSELLFPAAAQRSAEVTAWDAATFATWLRSRGFEVVSERRVARAGGEMKALDRFADKLGAIPEQALLTGAVDLTVRRAEVAQPGGPELTTADGETPEEATEAGASPPVDGNLLDRFDAITPGDEVLEIATSNDAAAAPIEVVDVTVRTVPPEKLADDSVEPDSCDVILCSGVLDRLELERLDDACRALFRALRPGGQLLLRIGGDGEGRASTATILVGLLRAGLEVVAAEDSERGADFRLLRPLELAEIVRFSGIGG
jgi:hypothetical protein